MVAQKVGCIVSRQVSEFCVDEWPRLWVTVILVVIIGALIVGPKSVEGNLLDCEKSCEPYRSQFIDGECACMDSEKRWVSQKGERTPE